MRVGKTEGYYCTPDYRIGNRPHTAELCIMYIYLLHTLSIQISKTKLLVKMASESRRFANLMEEDLQEIIDNKDLLGKTFMRHSKTNTTWFISRSSETSWFHTVLMCENTFRCFALGSSLTHPKPRDQEFLLFPSIPCCICIMWDHHSRSEESVCVSKFDHWLFMTQSAWNLKWQSACSNYERERAKMNNPIFQHSFKYGIKFRTQIGNKSLDLKSILRKKRKETSRKLNLSFYLWRPLGQP